MSDGDVSLIHDEDVLRRMWQQTEDFSRKKEIRAHMYRLREERLRNLYSPEPSGDGKDLKALSNAGWNVEQENRTTDDGHTHVKSVNANIEGRYDVEGGKGQFAAVDKHKEAITEYQDDTSSLKRNETSSNTAAREHVVRQTDDGTHISSTTSSSTSTSKFQQVSSSRHDTVPYVANDDYDLRNHDHDTNRNEEVTKRQITKTNDFEQNLRSDYNNENLVSRKIEYPDDNTRVIIETRCLPDGTRVTSTRREFRPPAQARSEHYQTRENKSYSTQQRSDIKESTSKITKQVTGNRATDIVDSQRNVDEYDFKRQIADYTTTDNDNYDVRHDTRVRKVVDRSNTDDDYSQTTRYETRTNKVIESSDNDDYVQTVRRNQQHYDTDDREVITTRDDKTHTNQQRYNDDREVINKRDDRFTQQKDYRETQGRDTEEKIHNIRVDKKVEEVIQKKTTTDHQTTYNADYSRKKISNDWSPTHQAWASTLRADTPTTRPSTRASSPGSKTFKSSTSSLRSSISPDKTNRKPTSRGGSPNKVDRNSPTRTVSDRYSNTHSTHSVTEVKTHKFTSPDERRPPTGRSPTRPGYSPERKPQDHRQRPSQSPEKRPQDHRQRPSQSPEKRPQDFTYRPSISPDKNTSPSGFPRTGSPTRPIDQRQTPTKLRQSPERKSGYKPSSDKTSPDSVYSRTISPNKLKISPDKTPTDGYSKDASPTRPSQSPDKKPGFQKPTDGQPSLKDNYARTTSPSRPHQLSESTKRPGMSPADKPSDKYPKDTTPDRSSASPERKPGYMKPTAASKPTDNLKSPTKPSAAHDAKSPTKYAPSTSPDRRPQDHTETTTKIQEDHYKFIDEETKMYTRVDKKYPDTKDTPDESSPKNLERSSDKKKSPGEDTPDYRIDTSAPRDRSPSLKGTLTLTEEIHDRLGTTVKKVDITSKRDDMTEEVTNKYQAPKHKDTPTGESPNDKNAPRKPSPSKYGTYDKKKPFDDVNDIKPHDDKNDSLPRREKTPKQSPDQPTSPTKKSPRESVSPVKPVAKDTKYKHTTDFISTERTTEEINKKTIKDRPRQLVTPSSSPTRKPKAATEPSTGQSSPTTSVSGFVYFSSPRTEETVVTDLDDQETYTETHTHKEMTDIYKRPENLDIKRSPSPSKIPCRSPSPDKSVSPSKDSLPRKSSLKKPTDTSQASPIEKPPSSFRVSPDELKDFSEHKIVKKDHTDRPEIDAPGKPKPPLERRETYEDRCRKILGMTDDTTETVVKETKYLKEPDTNLSSPSVSPCRSPVPKESPFGYPTTKKTDSKKDVTDFISHEQENTIKTTTTRRDDVPSDKKPKTPRETSPTKLQNIVTKTTTTGHIESETLTETTKTKYPRESPERKPSRPKDKHTLDKSKPTRYDIPKDRESPERPGLQRPKDTEYLRTSPSRGSDSSPRDSLSPERKPRHKSPEKKPSDKYPREQSPEKAPGYKITTTSVTNEYDSTTVHDSEETTLTTKKYPSSQPSKSPTRKASKPSDDNPSKTSPNTTEPHPGYQRPTRTRASPEEKPNEPYSREASPSKPGYMKTTESVTCKFDTTTEDVQETTPKHVETRHTHRTPQSPTRKISKPADDSLIDRSPNHKPDYERPSPTRSSPVKEHRDRHPKQPRTTPGYMQTTESVTSRFDTTEDVEETLTKHVETKDTHRSTESPTRKAPKPDHTPFDIRPGDDHTTHSQFSPVKETGNRPRKEPEIPGYMRTTASVTSKYDSTVEDYEETISEMHKTKHTTSRPSESPTTKLKTSDDSPSQLHPSDKSPSRKPGYEEPSRTSPERRPGHETLPTRPIHKALVDMSPKEPSLTKQKPEIVPGYMKTTESATYRQDTTTEDVEETCTSRTVHREHPSPQPDSSTSQAQKPRPKVPHDSECDIVLKPTKPTDTLTKQSTDRKPGYHVPEPSRDSPARRPGDRYPKEQSPSRRDTTEKTLGYIKTTTTKSSNRDETYIEDTEDITTIKTSRTRHPSSRTSVSPTRPTSRSVDSPTRGYPTDSLDRKPSHQSSPRASPDRKAVERYPKGSSPIRPETDRSSEFTRKTTSIKTKLDTSEDTQETVTSKSSKPRPSEVYKEPKTTITSKYGRTPSPSKTHPTERTKATKATKPDCERPLSPSSKKPGDRQPKESSPTRLGTSPDRNPSYVKPTASVTSKYDTTSTTEDIDETTMFVGKEYPKSRSSVSPTRRSSEEPSITKPKYPKEEPGEPRQLRTPSPTKKYTKVTEISTDFIMSEREKEVLDKVQQSLRKLSPERKEKSPNRERSPGKTTTSLQDLDIRTHTIKDDEDTLDDITEITDIKKTTKVEVSPFSKPKDEKPKDQKVPSKPSSRNVSPTKKPSGIASPTKIEKGPDSPGKPRSISPRKPLSPTERPQSPQAPRASGIKPKEPVASHLTRKPTPATLSTTKLEKTVNDVRKTTGITSISKQTNLTKTSQLKTPTKSLPLSTSKEPETRRAPTPKGIRDTSRKDTNTKVMRTSSDITIKSKKTSPQRMKSKPEIQVSDMSTKTTPNAQKPIKEPHTKLPSKSATTLNTSTEDDDVIIDVEQSKSSRENSPDRICPTPVNFGDDVGTPRFPDEVSEPDDEFRKRTHHTIHETESIVDDIVEICEDDELFVRKTYSDNITEDDEHLFNVTGKVTKFTKRDGGTKPKDSTTVFKDIEKKVHSDFISENLKSDECLLSVSEKVNKFAKGPRDTKDSRSPSRKVTDEYDRNTTYQDDYTKLSVHDKAHLFVETAENVKAPKVKPAPQKAERPDLSNVDESLKSDDCLLSVSDKVNKFVKTAEHFMTETQDVEEKEKKIKEQHDKIMRKIVEDVDDDTYEGDVTTEVEDTEEHTKLLQSRIPDRKDDKTASMKDTTSSHGKVKDHGTPNAKPTEKVPTVKITTQRSSEAVKKAKALFENIASTTQKTKEITTKTTKLTDIGVLKKAKRDSPATTAVLHPSEEDVSPNVTDVDSEVDAAPYVKDRPSSGTLTRPHQPRDEKPKSSPSRLTTESPEVPRSKSPMRHTVATTTTKTVLTRYPTAPSAESPKQRPGSDKPDKVPGYLRPTKTSQSKEEPKVEDTEVSSRRGSGKFGVELRTTSVERLTVSSERRRSVEHPCIEDIYDLDLLEQMLEKVVGYEQRRRIRAQIRVARKRTETEHVVDTNTYTRTTKHIATQRTPERQQRRSPERSPKSNQKTVSPDRQSKTPQRSVPERSQPKEHPVFNGHSKEPSKAPAENLQKPHSPEKLAPKSVLKTKSPARPASPEKKTRTQSPLKTATPKSKPNRFNEYASAYMKKVGLNDADKVKFSESKTKKVIDDKKKVVKQVAQHKTSTVEEYSTSKTFTERTSSKDVIEVHVNGKRSPSPEKRKSPDRKAYSPERKAYSPERKAHSADRNNHSPDRNVHSPDHKPHSPDRNAHSPDRKAQSPERKAQSPERKAQSPERLHQRTPSPQFKRQKSDTGKTQHKEPIIKTVYDIEKKIPQKPVQEEKPTWVTNRNLKKITSETRTFSSKKIEEKPKYRAQSPSKVISKPIDVITSSYGPGPLDSDGKPLFGIRALRNGASNYQVKGTVIRQEFHSRNGGEPEGTVSVTAYSTEPEDLERLLQGQGEPPSRIHGLAAITTTKKFGGETGTTLKEVHGKDERAAIDQFTHSDRRVFDSKIEDLTEQTFDTQEGIVGATRRIESRREEIVGDRKDGDRTQRRVEKVTERKGQKMDSRERVERTEDKKTVRQSSVKSLTEKYIKSTNESSKSDRSSYPKAGLILRTTTMKDSVSSDSSAHAGLARTDSEHSLGSVEDSTVVTTTSEQVDGGVRTVTTTTRTEGHVQRGERSFLDSSTKVTGVQDILTRMKNADIVIQEGDTSEDTEARALLNKFLGATVLMAGMQGYVSEKPSGKVIVKQETVRSSGGKVTSSSRTEEIDIDQCWDERVLRKLLDECSDYEQRRRLRGRIRTLMAEQEACASAVTEALAAAGESADGGDGSEAREEEVTVTSSVRRNSSEKTVSSTTTTKTSKVIESMTRPAPKPVSPFAKFRQLEKQNSTNSPKM